VVLIADGCFSNFLNSVVEDGREVKVKVRSHFVGTILKHALLLIQGHGTIALVNGYGPVSTHDTCVIVDVKVPLPSDLKVTISYYFYPFLIICRSPHILDNVMPQLPPTPHVSIHNSFEKDHTMNASLLSAFHQTRWLPVRRGHQPIHTRSHSQSLRTEAR
jgi:squalene monooxygenase